MAENLKLFNEHSEYEDFIQTEGFTRPNVSYCIEENEVHYNPYTDPRLIIKYYVDDASNATFLFNYSYYEGVEEEYSHRAIDLFEKVEIDGEEISLTDLDSSEGYYQLSIGEHIVKYTLKNPTVLKNELFANCEKITSVDVPYSVISIGDHCFSYCTALTTVVLNENVATIECGAFDNCRNLTSINIPNNASISECAFSRCKGLPSEDNMVYIGTTLIGPADSTLTSYSIKEGTEIITCSAFQDCANLTSITIPSSVTSINDNAFQDCRSLTSVTFEQGSRLTEIGRQAFNGCSGLTRFNSSTNGECIIPSGVTIIDDYAFNYCSGLTSVVIPSGVTKISCFSSCKNLTSVTFEQNSQLVEFGYGAFSSCSGLTSITIPSGVTTIGYYAFMQCSNLRNVTIPSGVTSISDAAFQKCTNLTIINVLPVTPPSLGSYVFADTASIFKIYVPSESVAAYKAASGWSSYSSRIMAMS